MLPWLASELRDFGYRVERSKLWAYAPGTIPVLLVAHIDVVHKRQTPKVYLDPDQGCLWSPDGLGADDRAGVWGTLACLERGFRPHVLFTDLEESGGGGARAAAKALLPKVRFMIEMDRRGDNDCVFYDDENKDAVKYCESYGFKEATGSFTDISVLMPAWGVSGVNLSIGYYNQHSTSEHMILSEAYRTVNRVCLMLKSPPTKLLAFTERKKTYSGYGAYSGGSYSGTYVWSQPSKKTECDNCQELVAWSDWVYWGKDNKVCKPCYKALAEMLAVGDL